MIVVDRVTKTYRTRAGRRLVLDNVNLTLARGEHVGILGRNGAGKSTLIRLIAGAEMPTRGRILRGMRVSWPLAFSGGFQGSLTGRDNIRFVCRIYGVEIEPAIAYVESFSELGVYLREPVKTYSSGMRARLAFALSMAIEFDCYLIDEVIAVGDSRFQEKCKEELFERRASTGKIIVSHDLGLIESHCDTVWVLHDAKATCFAHAAEALDYYRTL